MQGGHGTSRKAVMHNDFIVVGPADDPAKIKGTQLGGRGVRSDREGGGSVRVARRRVRHPYEGAVALGGGGDRARRLVVHRDRPGDGGDAHDREPEAGLHALGPRHLPRDRQPGPRAAGRGRRGPAQPLPRDRRQGRRREPSLCRRTFSDWITSAETQREIGALRGRGVRRAAVRRRRRGLMDPVHEVLGRSALVSLSATAIALALGVPLGTWLALSASARPGGARDRRQHRHGGPDGGRRTGRGAAAVAKRAARRPRADLHAARNDHRPGPDRHTADRRHHHGGAAGAAAGARGPAAGAGRQHAAARLPAVDRGARAAARRRDGRVRARDLRGRRGHDRRRQHPRPDAGDDHLDRRERRAAATSTTRWSTRRSCSRSPSRSTPCSHRCSSARPHGLSPEAARCPAPPRRTRGARHR